MERISEIHSREKSVGKMTFERLQHTSFLEKIDRGNRDTHQQGEHQKAFLQDLSENGVIKHSGLTAHFHEPAFHIFQHPTLEYGARKTSGHMHVDTRLMRRQGGDRPQGHTQSP